MKLPNAEQATVEAAKLQDYLLSHSHPIGRFKAAFFARLGFTDTDWQLLREVFLEHARSNEAGLGEVTAFGQKYEVRGTITGPTGRQASLVTVWIVKSEGGAPRFITAFPG